MYSTYFIPVSNFIVSIVLAFHKNRIPIHIVEQLILNASNIITQVYTPYKDHLRNLNKQHPKLSCVPF